MELTSEDIKLIEKFADIKNRGYYADGKQVTEAYNRILNKSLSPTNCGSCIRGRITEMENVLNKYKEQLAKEEENKPKEEEKPKARKNKKGNG